MLSDGTVWSTGKGTNGELGNGTNENTSIFVQGLTLVENGNEENRADTGPAPTEGDNAEDSNVDALTSHISPLTSVLCIGRNNGSLNTAVILENGSIYVTGNNTYKQITNEQEGRTNYYVPMRYIDIEAPEEIELQVGGNRTLKEDELKYQKDTINVYKQDLLEIPLIEYTQTEDEKIATYEQGKIEALEVGSTKLKVEERTHNILFYIPVKTYGKIIGSITTENHEGKHIAEVILYQTLDTNELGANALKSARKEELSTIKTNEDGTYEIKVYEPGMYNVKITKTGYLNTRIIDIEVGEKDGIIEIEEQELVAGDVAESGEIEIDDLVDLNDNYGIEVTEENKEEKSKYDLNEDGKIDILDREILKKNYGKIAEEIKWVP